LPFAVCRSPFAVCRLPFAVGAVGAVVVVVVLQEKHITRGYALAAGAGLCVVLGSRCSVSPACDMPISVGQSGRDLVVVNLQRTAADDHARMRIGAKIDDVMVPLMRRLGIAIPEFRLCRTVRVAFRSGGSGSSGGSGGGTTGSGIGAKAAAAMARPVLAVSGVDADGLPVDVLWNVQARFTRKATAAAAAATATTTEGANGSDSAAVVVTAAAAAAAAAGPLAAASGSGGGGVGGGGGGGGGGGRSISISNKRPPLFKSRLRFNQDTRSKPLAPGDLARVQTWPWENVENPGCVCAWASSCASSCASCVARRVRVRRLRVVSRTFFQPQ
jgi:hypothetical protein